MSRLGNMSEALKSACPMSDILSDGYTSVIKQIIDCKKKDISFL